MATEVFTDAGAAVVTSGGTTVLAAGASETWTVTAVATPTATTGINQFHVIDVADTSSIPEVMLVTSGTAGTGVTWTVTRGVEGTAPVAHLTGFTVKPVVSSSVLASFAQVGQASEPSGFSDLQAVLSEGQQSAAILIEGDSTGATTSRWPYLMGQLLGARYPAYTVQWTQWNDTNQNYDAPVSIQTGTGGAFRAQSFKRDGSTQSATAPGNGLAFSGDIDARVKVSQTDWTYAAVLQTLVGRYGSAAGTRSFLFSYKPSALVLAWSADGTNAVQSNVQSLVAPSTLGLTANNPYWFRVTLTVATGVVAFYSSTDGQTWNALGGTQTFGATSVFNPTAAGDFEIGARGLTSAPLDGTIYQVEVRDGIGGLQMLPIIPDLWTQAHGTSTLSGSPVLTIVNGSISGATVTYLNDSTRNPKLSTIDYGPAVCVLSTSHNDTTRHGLPYLADWDTWVTRIRAKHPNIPLVAMTQNPKTSPADYITAHQARRHDVAQWARKSNYGLIDVYGAFLADGRALSVLDNTDGIHPSDAAGSPLWAAVALNALLARA